MWRPRRNWPKLGQRVRNLREHGLKEGASTRVLIYAGALIKEGVLPRRACHVAVTWGITETPRSNEASMKWWQRSFP
jgi:hypothetical protein